MAKKVLLIDDDQSTIEITEFMLKKAGFDVIVAVDGFTGIKKAEEENPDVILLDFHMPGPDGYEVCEKIKTSPKTSRIPIIMITGTKMGRGVEEELIKRADGFIAKPFDGDVLIKFVNKLITEDKK